MDEEMYILSEGLLEVGDLILKYLQNEINADEQDLLDKWIAKSEKNKKLFDELTNNASLLDRMKLFYQSSVEAEEVIKKEFAESVMVKPMHQWLKIAVAAAVIILIAGYWLLSPRSTKHVKPEVAQQQMSNDIQPGQYKAMLTLANGQKIVLDSSATTKRLQQGNTSILNKDGQLTYAASKNNIQHEVLYNTLTTAKGEVYTLTLSDGSRVWLNSASSVRYPVAFTSLERKVEITGEAYFEVSHNSTKIFKVSAGGIETEVLGTKFNINAYSDEKVKRITLLEGSIKITPLSLRAEGKVLTPGQQAEVNNAGALQLAREVDTEQVLAWKNGMFVFNKTNIETIMHEIQRWYDVETSYEGNIRGRSFTGQISRYSNASKVMEMLQATGDLHYKIEGKKIIVMP
jgi:transmembrane sensor